jgi:hypothetical protein
MIRKLLGNINVDFDVKGQQPTTYSALVKYLKKSGNKMGQCISCQQISRKLSINFGGSHNILVQHGTALKLGTD